MIAMAPVGGTKSWNASTIRIGLKALITITDELFGRNIGDGFPVVVRHARIDEHEIKTIRPKTSAQGRNLSGIVDVDGLDVEPAISLADKIVQSGFRPITHGGDHTPAELQVLFRDRQSQATGGAEQEKTFFQC